MKFNKHQYFLTTPDLVMLGLAFLIGIGGGFGAVFFRELILLLKNFVIVQPLAISC